MRDATADDYLAAVAAQFDGETADQIRAVFATETPCPGGHRTDDGQGDYEDLWRDVMDEHDIPDEIETSTDLAIRMPQRSGEIGKIVLSRWVVAGDCKLTIPVHEEWDGDGEWTSFCYPVADGPCAESMLLNEKDWEGAFWAAYLTQERLRVAVEAILTKPTRELIPVHGRQGSGEMADGEVGD